MKTDTFKITPFHPCNDAARARGDIAGWDIRDETGLVVDSFDTREEAEAFLRERGNTNWPPTREELGMPSKREHTRRTAEEVLRDAFERGLFAGSNLVPEVRAILGESR